MPILTDIADIEGFEGATLTQVEGDEEGKYFAIGQATGAIALFFPRAIREGCERRLLSVEMAKIVNVAEEVREGILVEYNGHETGFLELLCGNFSLPESLA